MLALLFFRTCLSDYGYSRKKSVVIRLSGKARAGGRLSRFSAIVCSSMDCVVFRQQVKSAIATFSLQSRKLFFTRFTITCSVKATAPGASVNNRTPPGQPLCRGAGRSDETMATIVCTPHPTLSLKWREGSSVTVCAMNRNAFYAHHAQTAHQRIPRRGGE